MSGIEAFRTSVAKSAAQYASAKQETQKARIILKKAEESENAAYRYWKDMVRSLNDWEGDEKNCDHDLVTDVSGRGVGFDTQCRKCGWFENPFPVY